MKKSGLAIKILSGVCALALLFAPVGVPLMSMSVFAETAAYTFTNSLQTMTTPFREKFLSIADGNGNFEATSSGSNVSGWTSSFGDSSRSASGVISATNFNDFKETNNKDKKLPHLMQQPTTLTSNALILANIGAGKTHASYHTTNPISLYADGYFIVSAKVYAVGGYATVGIEWEGESVPVENVDKYIEIAQVDMKDDQKGETSKWETVNFFVKTDKLQPASVSIILYLGDAEDGGEGAAYFDDISVMAVSADSFKTREANATPNTGVDYKEIVDYTNKNAPTIEDIIELPNFTADANKNGTFAGVNATTGDIKTNIDMDNLIGSTQENESDVSYVASNSSEIKLVSEADITLEPMQVYMLSFYALAEGDATVRFYEQAAQDILDKDDYVKTPEQEAVAPFDSDYLAVKTTQNDSSAAHNAWVLNTFFITGNEVNPTDLKIAFYANHSATESAFLMIDELKFEKVKYSYFDEVKSGENATEVSAIKPTTDTTPITNGRFNKGHAGFENVWPAVATGWTATTATENIKNGILSLDYWDNNMPKPSGNGNVGFMRNNGNHTQSVVSSEFSLTPSSVNYVSFDLASDISVKVSINISGKTYAEMDTIKNSTEFRHYKFEIQEATTAHSITIKFTLAGSGYAIMDNVACAQTDENADISPNATADFSNLLLLADKNGNSLPFENTDNIQAYVENETLRVQVNATTDAIKHQITGKMGDTLTADTYYKYVIEFDMDADLSKVGFGISGYDGGITNLTRARLYANKYTTMSGDNKYKTVELYFKGNADTTTLDLVITFADEEEGTISGSGINIKSVALETSDEATFNAVSEEETEKLGDDESYVGLRACLTATAGEDEEEETADETPTEKGSLDWVIIPTIITGLAILIAVVGVILRKVKFKKHIKHARTSYARDDKTQATDNVLDIKATKAADHEDPTDDDDTNK
ncbi:MAG: hypothetical protein LBM01_01355 [Christensenellaceae bacterium]|jgi:hypothetical protein|nr:hypothetical protein [Christensenellaceae bacterium]